MIVEVDQAAVARAGDLQRLMVGAALGKPLAIKVLRGKSLVDLKAVLVELG
jgi:S1-C subfamily serine protease